MAVDIEKLSMPDFLALLRYEGKPPPGPEFDAIRMTPQEWDTLFPGAVQREETEEADGSDDAAEVPTAQPATAAQ
jgi:hypothetical protein